LRRALPGWAAALLATLAILLGVPAAASAHATVSATSPSAGERLEAAPAEVTVRFNEPVELAFGALRVYDAQGRQVGRGETFRPGGDSKAIGIRLPAELPSGGCTATYRVLSADSHPVSGGFVFAIGSGGPPAAGVDALLAGSESGPITTTALSAVRAVQYGAIALAIGAFAFALACWAPVAGELAQSPRAAFRRATRRLLVVVAGAGLLASLAGVVLQATVGSGDSVWDALAAGPVGDVLGTRFGVVWIAAAAAWSLLGALAATGSNWGRGRLAIGLLLTGALALLPALGGHAAAESPRGPLVMLNVAHVVGAGAWLGGVAMLVFVLRRATRTVEGDQRGRLLATVVSRFSTLAAAAIALVLLSGVGQSLLYVSAPGQLTSTAYGRALLVKLATLAAILALGAVQRSRVLPRLRAAAARPGTGAAGRRLRQVLLVELGVGVLAIAATGALATYAPSEVAASAGPVSRTAQVGPARLDLTVDPAAPGPNALHLYLFDRRDGTPFDRVVELTAKAELPAKDIAPIEIDLRPAGAGHWTAPAAPLAPAGTWTLGVRARVSDFDAYEAALEVPIE
jgi:copper transport protein